jgi:hypothetical protein
MSEWNVGRGSWKDGMPLGASAEDFLLENAQWVIYFRKDHRFPCPTCYDMSTQSRISVGYDCETCFGFGKKVDPILVPARISFGPPKVTSREADIRQNPGYIEFFSAEIDFPRAVKPKLEDLVLVCEWSKPTQQLGKPRARPLSITSIYVIKQVNDYFERELSWYGCGAEAYDLEMHLLEEQLPRLVNLPILDVTSNFQARKFW